MVMSSLGQLVIGAFFHTVISSQASIVQSYVWAMLNYAGETGKAGEAGNGYSASFAAMAIFQDTPMIRPANFLQFLYFRSARSEVVIFFTFLFQIADLNLSLSFVYCDM